MQPKHPQHILKPSTQFHKLCTWLPSWLHRFPIKYEWREDWLYYKINHGGWQLPKPFITLIAFARILLKAISGLSRTRNEDCPWILTGSGTKQGFAAHSKRGSEDVCARSPVKRLIWPTNSEENAFSERTISHSLAPVFSLDFHRWLPKVTWAWRISS